MEERPAGTPVTGDSVLLQARDCAIDFKPDGRKDLEDVVVRLETDKRVVEAALVAVGDLTMLEPRRATSIRGRKGGLCDVSFPAWDVLRFVKTGEKNRVETPIRLSGVLDDGTEVNATSMLTVVIEEKNSKK